MPHYANAEERRTTELQFVDRVYRLRLVGTLCCGLAVAVTLIAHGCPYGGWIWLGLLLNAVAWPLLAWRCSRCSSMPVRTERRQLMADGLLMGFWIAAVGLSPVPSTVLICSLMAGRVSYGHWRTLLLTLWLLASSLSLGWLALGRPWWPDLAWPAAWVGLCCLIVYVLALSYVLRTHLQVMLELNEELQRESRIDASIELPNRRYFESCLNEALGRFRCYHQVASLLLIDVDHFKAVNDLYGHQAGDRVLGGIADILRATVRSGDLPARYGGDEFAVLLIHANRLAAEHAAERICRMLESHVLEDGTALACTLSIGVAEVSVDHTSVQDWVNAADAALYKAKAAGRNCIVAA